MLVGRFLAFSYPSKLMGNLGLFQSLEFRHTTPKQIQYSNPNQSKKTMNETHRIRGDRFPNQVAITSSSGAGSSSLLALYKSKEHGPKGPYRYVSGGDMMRLLAAKQGLGIEDFCIYRAEHPEEGIDRKVDAMLNAFATQDFGIFEGRLVHVLCPGAFKVLLTCDLDVRAQRKGLQLHKASTSIKVQLEERDRVDTEIYISLYGPGCIWGPSQFDLVIDTAVLDEKQTFDAVVQAHDTWRKRLEEDGLLVEGLTYELFGVNTSTLHLPSIESVPT